MEPIIELLTSYTDLNGSRIVELKTEPSPLEFMRFVALNTPFVVKNATSEWRATKLWGSSYFRNALRGQMINVAVTPNGFDILISSCKYNELPICLHVIGMPILPLLSKAAG
jgi:hypothetical protein